MQELDINTLLIIVCVAVGTYTLRVSGLLLSNKFASEGSIKVFLDFLPSTLLLALILPAIIKEGVSGIIATICIIICMQKSTNPLISMCVGVGIVFLSRNFF